MRRLIIAVVVIGLVGLGVVLLSNHQETKPSPTAPIRPTASTEAMTVVAEGLEVPWAVAFAPDGRMFVTERPGRVRVIKDGKLESQPALTVQVPGSGEGGLQGLALDPKFADNHFAYLYVSYSGDGIRNRIVRYHEDGGKLADPKTLVDNIPGNNNHNGGRLAFGPDGKLYATTGDSQEPSLAQDKTSLAGKILRLNSDGSTPPDNPFGNLVWSYGHRNPQGIAWTKDGRLFETEHGPSGDLGLCCRDELNKIDRGGNYGWPLAQQGQTGQFIAAVLSSGDSTTWAPADLAIAPDGSLYFSTLRGEHLHHVVLSGDTVARQEELYNGQFGRLRESIVGPDGALYITTSNRDGRGDVQAGDDKLIRIRL